MSGKWIITKENVYQTEKLVSLLFNQDGKLVEASADNPNCLDDDSKALNVGNIYVGKVQNLSKTMDSAFVEVLPGQICYLSLQKEHKILFLNQKKDHILKSGDEILVQIKTEGVKMKQPSVSCSLSLAGTFCVVSLGDSSIHYSSKLSKQKKKEVQEFLSDEMPFPMKYSYTIRTNVADLSDYQMVLDEMEELTRHMEQLLLDGKARTCYSCLYEELPGYLKRIQGSCSKDCEEIVTDIPEVFHQLKKFFPNNSLSTKKIRFYEDSLRLSTLYSIKSKLEEALGRRIWLKSGGSLIIEPTEALTVIDVNSGKYEASGKGSGKDALKKINFEAAQEIATQIKLRNISGIIVIDFINMKTENDNLELLSFLKQCVKKDSVATQVIDMTPLGLVEITRKKVHKTLLEQIKS